MIQLFFLKKNLIFDKHLVNIQFSEHILSLRNLSLPHIVWEKALFSTKQTHLRGDKLIQVNPFDWP